MIAIEFAPPTLPTEGALALLALEGAARCRPVGGGGRGLRRRDHPRRRRGRVHRQEGPDLHHPRARRRPAARRADRLGQGGRSYAARHGGGRRPRRRRTRQGRQGRHSRSTPCRPATPRTPPSAPACAATASTATAPRRTPTPSRASRSLTVLTDDPDAAQAAWPALDGIAHGTQFARDLISEPPNVLNPAEMAERCRALAELGLEVEVLGPAELDASKASARCSRSRRAAPTSRGSSPCAGRAAPPDTPARLLRRQGRHLRHRRHQPQARRRHGRHEMGHGGRRRRRRRHGGARPPQGARQRRRRGRPVGEHAQRHRASDPATSCAASPARPSRC